MNMKYLRLLSVCLFVIGRWCTLSTSVSAAPVNKGRIFFVCFMENRLLVDHPRPRLYITSLESTRIIVAIRVPLIDQYPDVFLELLPGQGLIHEMQVDLSLAGSNTEDKGVLVEASGDISVQGASINDLSTDAYLAFPMDALSHDYYIMSYMFNNASQNKQGPSQFAVVGIKEFTGVEITLPRADIKIIGSNWHFEDNKTRITLHFCETLQIQSYQDLTGTRIRATYPVAVFAGDVWISVGEEHMGDHIVEQMPPTATWGTEFISAPIISREDGDVYRVLARMNNTKLKIYKQKTSRNNTLYDLIGLQQSEFHEFDVGSDEALLVISNRPVLVAQFCKSYGADGNRVSDPFMTLVPPTMQYLDEYSFQTLTSLHGSDEFTHFVNVVVLTKDTDGVRLDHSPVPQSVITRDWTEIWLTNYSYATFEVSSGYHRIYSQSAFAATAYGLKYQESYGLILGQSMQTLPYECTETDIGWADFFDNDSDGKMDEEIANGIDDDGDGLIDEDIFNEFRARDPIDDIEADTSALAEAEDSMLEYYDILEVDFIDNFEDQEILSMAPQIKEVATTTPPKTTASKKPEPPSFTYPTRSTLRSISLQKRSSKHPPAPVKIQEIKRAQTEETPTSDNIDMTTAAPELKADKFNWTMFIVIPVCIIFGLPALCCVCLFGKYCDCGRKKNEEVPHDKKARKAKKPPRHNKVKQTPPPKFISSEIQPVVPFTVVRSHYELTGMPPGPLAVPGRPPIAEESPASTTLVPCKNTPGKNSTSIGATASSPASSSSTHSLVPLAQKKTTKKKPKGVIIG